MNIDNPETALALTYAPRAARSGLAALFAFDEALARLLRTTREPAIGQIRLAWWRDRLLELAPERAPAEPVLAALAAHAVPRGIAGAMLVPIVDGWEELLEAEVDAAALDRFATGRGGALFEAGGRLAGGDAPFAAAGEGWALADLALHLSDPEGAAAARAKASARLAVALARPWPREARAFGALAWVARDDLRVAAGAARPVGAPRRVTRMLWHRITGW